MPTSSTSIFRIASDGATRSWWMLRKSSDLIAWSSGPNGSGSACRAVSDRAQRVVASGLERGAPTQALGDAFAMESPRVLHPPACLANHLKCIQISGMVLQALIGIDAAQKSQRDTALRSMLLVVAFLVVDETGNVDATRSPKKVDFHDVATHIDLVVSE